MPQSICPCISGVAIRKTRLIPGSTAPLACRSGQLLGGAELDLLVFAEGRRIGYEFKYAEQPRFTRSMRVAMEDLRLDSLAVICPGTAQATLASGVEVRGIETFAGSERQ